MFNSSEELQKQIALGEDSSLELKDLHYKGGKVNKPHRNSVADEMAAMANSFSGVFVFGVDDKSREITGISKDKLDTVETWLLGICNDLIHPPLSCNIRKIFLFDTEGTERAAIRVDIPKSLYVHNSPGGYFYRIGSSKRKISPEMLARLFQQRSQTRLIRYDEQSVPFAPLECLIKKLWNRFRTELSPKDDREFLSKIKLTTESDEGKACPSVSGILMASEQPEEYITNAFIQAVCYRGTERNANYQVDAKDITGPLDEQIREACKFVNRNMRIYAIKDQGRIDIPQYDMNAVFEAVANAVAHRDYSVYMSKIRLHMFADRIELFSPGSIPNTMTIDSLPFRQSSRNELLTSLLARCSVDIVGLRTNRKFLMDKRGEGVPIIISESRKLSGRDPLYRLLDDAELMLTIYAAPPPEHL